MNKVGIVGCGAMGRGIAQLVAQAGMTVRLHDVSVEAALRARDVVIAQLDRLLQKQRMTQAQFEVACACLQVADTLADLHDCDLVVEAIIEKLDAKQDLFRSLEHVTGADCILASNTSSLSITAIAAACERPERVAGLHFFNPVPLMKLVEIVRALRTGDTFIERLQAFVQRTGHRAVLAQDTPGFIVNHAGRAFPTEALRIVQEGVCDFATVDIILREAAGFKLGPFELMDLIGLDVSHPVMEAIYHQYYEEARYRPSVLTAQRVAAGILGKKTQRGFYAYDGEPERRAEEVALPYGGPVWVSHDDLTIAHDLQKLLERCGAQVDYGPHPMAHAICLFYPLGEDLSTCVAREQLSAERCFAIDPLFDFQGRLTLMHNPASSGALAKSLQSLLQRSEKAVSLIEDSCGFVQQRVLAMIVNTACEIAQQKICSVEDLEYAVQTGLGYPHGPLTWGDRLGSTRILTILHNIWQSTGDMRYRPSLWLRRRVQLGLPLTFYRT